MSLGNAINTAVSALNAQSQAISMISDNISNSSTVGYKATTASFSSLVTQNYNSSSYASGGVAVTDSRNVGLQGLIESSTISTNLALDGGGFFVVSEPGNNGSADIAYTRNGEFSADKDGYLSTSAGYQLMGYRVDSEGNPVNGDVFNVDDLTAIDVDIVSGLAQASSTVTLSAGLPADAANGASVSLDVEFFDSLGVAHSTTLTYTKTGTNEWEMSFGNAVNPDDSTAITGTGSGATYDLVFDSSGKLSSVSPSPVELSFTALTSGAADINLTLDIQESGSLTQYAAQDGEIDLELYSLDTDGARYGRYTNVEIDDDGLVTANFDNGLSMAIYKIPVATFANPNALQALSNNVFLPTVDSGNYILKDAGEGQAGLIRSSSVESSTVDIADEFSRMIIAQQAYSAASKVVTTADEMIDTLMQAIR
ncbi:flagellar hook protein FlgE [Dongia rigui]|uniref:Flagellar hook protein FlgE n=1 Tax=Dongia rigui TaxID=940149 RepID=A0ABU5DUQ7_9PROT|nr:flagellar hook protein FlgE [Dongia rigui]MDY0870697.1 flagellar hook protein FlgE [Dongia rigui]